MSSPIVYSGEHPCFSNSCNKKAYYRIGTAMYCGHHSRPRAVIRATLPKRPKAPFDLDAQIAGAKALAGGQVRLQKMGMMRAVTQEPGWVCVFPNNKHANRKDGIGMASLSPMRLGPVQHGQPGFSPAQNLENFWQGSKRFAGESEGDFQTAKEAWFFDLVPRRHKVKGEKPLYWSWVSSDGTEHKLDYVTARQFYCHFYEELVLTRGEWLHLCALSLRHKMNIQICGYDAEPIEPTKEAIYQAYLDPSTSFGHERVLFAMLVIKREEDYPWNALWKNLS
jgi:hypothetical protein